MALRELLALNESIPQIQAAQAGDVYHAPRAVHHSDGTAALPAITFASDPDSGLFSVAAGHVNVSTDGVERIRITPTDFRLHKDFLLGWGSSGTVAPDLKLFRDAANTLAQRNSTNAQTFNLYNTFTDASNYERLGIKYDTNVITFASEAAGTGTAREFNFTGANFGVGLTNPSEKFHVDSLAATAMALFENNNALLFVNGASAPRTELVSRDASNSAFQALEIRAGSAGSGLTVALAGIGINQVSPDATSQLDVVSTTKGALLPRMTTTQRDAITTPATGLLIYNTTTLQLEDFNGTVWAAV